MTNPPRGSLALTGATIYPSPAAEPVRDGVVRIEDGRITAVGHRSAVGIPEALSTIDCSGLAITAGFWNSHVHFFERKWAHAATIPAPELQRQLEEMLTRWGLTSVFDLGSEWKNTQRLRDRIESGEVAGPRILSTGEPLIAAGALPPKIVFDMMGLMSYPMPEITSAEEAPAAARALLDAGVDGIKLHLRAPPSPGTPFPPDAMVTAAREAHDSGRPVFAHPESGADVLAALRAGVDVIAHTTPHAGPWHGAILDAAKKRRATLTPTLTLWKFFARHDRASTRDVVLDTAVEQLRSWIAAGGRVAFGTDLGAVDYDPREEYALMAQAGMGFAEILASLTVAPAEVFGASERLGRVAPGQSADLVVLEGDPATDIQALAGVAYTLRNGKVVYRAGA